MNIQFSETALTYVKADNSVVTLDMSSINNALMQISAVTTATPQTAPGLMSTFNESYSNLSKHLAFVRLELDRANALLTRRESEILLDEAVELLKVKNIKPTDSARKSLVPLDDRYNQLLENANMLKAVVKLMEGQLKSLDMAYMSVKKIFPSKYEGIKLNGNPNETYTIGDHGFKVGKVNY